MIAFHLKLPTDRTVHSVFGTRSDPVRLSEDIERHARASAVPQVSRDNPKRQHIEDTAFAERVDTIESLNWSETDGVSIG
jgi:hypothetical protein